MKEETNMPYKNGKKMPYGKGAVKKKPRYKETNEKEIKKSPNEKS